MAKDDMSLGDEMGRLEIEPVKINKNIKNENPFVHVTIPHQRRSLFSKTCLQNTKCSCSAQKKSKNVAIGKKKQTKILKEPVLKLLQSSNQNGSVRDECQLSTKCSSFNINPDNLNLCALVDNCNQLRISSDTNEKSLIVNEFDSETHWWKSNVSSTRQSRAGAGMSQPGSCSQQALNPPCDVTIDELASYFETLVHIPKKMSSMAEMMYI